MVVDAGHISLQSEMADKKALQAIRSKQSTQYTDEDWTSLEGLMYDKFHIELESTQVRFVKDSNVLSRMLMPLSDRAWGQLAEMYGSSRRPCLQPLSSGGQDQHDLARGNIYPFQYTQSYPNEGIWTSTKPLCQFLGCQISESDEDC